jgi:hypothetical protein
MQWSMLGILVAPLNIVLNAGNPRVALGEVMIQYLLKLLMVARNTGHCVLTAETI